MGFHVEISRLDAPESPSRGLGELQIEMEDEELLEVDGGE